MKIVYIAYSIIPSRSANSVHVMKMCQAMADNGHEVLLIAPDKKEEYEKGVDDIYSYYGVKNNFRVKQIAYYKDNKLVKATRLFFVLLKEKPDLVFGRDMFGCFIGSLLNYNTGYETHSPYSEIEKRSKIIFNSLIKRKSFKGIVVISDALKCIYKAEKVYQDLKIIVAHDGADEVADFNKIADLSGKPNCLKIGYIGHLYQGRGIDLIIEAAKRLEVHEFHIVGGTEEDICYWKKELQKSNTKNVFFYGFTSPSETGSYRNAFDILLAPYAKEVKVQGNVGNTSAYMSPLKIFEYMAHKKAIITSDLPVLREVLNEKNSVLAVPEEVDSWVNAIVRLEDEKVRDYVANNAYRDFLSHYSWQTRAKNIIDRLSDEK